MHATKREAQILNMVRLHGSVTTMDLAEMLDVSDQTIRRSVKPLVKQGLVEKVHGAIVAPDRLLEPPFHRRMLEQQNEKQRIAQKVASLIKDGDSIMLDAGSTTAYIAHALCDKKNLTVVTNSAQIASTLAPITGNRVFMAGSELRNHDVAAFDATALNTFRQFDVQYAILSVAALNHNRGFMVQQQYEAELSRVLIELADQAIVAAYHSKFERKALAQVCAPEQIDILITDQAPLEDLSKALKKWNVETLIA